MSKRNFSTRTGADVRPNWSPHTGVGGMGRAHHLGAGPVRRGLLAHALVMICIAEMTRELPRFLPIQR